MSLTLSYNRHQQLTVLEHDVNVSVKEKTTAFKLLSIILKNLNKEPSNPKFRQLKLTNAKIQQMTRHSALMQYLQMTIGFTQSTTTQGEAVLILPETLTLDPLLLEEALRQAQDIYQRLESTNSTTSGGNPKALGRSGSSTLSAAGSTHSTASSTNSGPLSEKQKARLLMEQKEAAEKIAAKEARKRTAQQIKDDKRVRQHDENWKPGVSAAAAKTGTSMQTFRDRHGE